MERSAKIVVVGVVLIICLLVVTTENAFSEEYSALKGLKSIEAVFDFEQGDPQGALRRLNVIDQTFKDKNTRAISKKPDFVVVFIGPAVKLVSRNMGGFTAENQKMLEEFTNAISRMAKDGIRFEICLIAAKGFGVEPSMILPEITQVGNGWISLIGYQARGFSLVPVL